MVEFLDLGLRPYLEILSIQEELRKKNQEGLIKDTVIFCEHSPVFTIGKRDCSEDFISDFKAIAGAGIDIVKTERGGKITYHGPGQAVGYFIINIEERKLGVKDFVFKVEEVCRLGLESFGISAERDKEYPGLWVNKEKIAAVGLSIQKGVSCHGFALNVSCDLTHYKHIVPCGIRGRGVTSMQKILQTQPEMVEVFDSLKKAVSEIF